MNKGRGLLTDEIIARSRELLGEPISQEELRLMPYIQYRCINFGKIESKEVNASEMAIMNRWEMTGHGVFFDGIRVTKGFWDAMSEIVWLGYAVPTMKGVIVSG